MNQAPVLSQHSQQPQQQPGHNHNSVANGRDTRGLGSENNCNNNNIQSGPILSSINTLNKDIDDTSDSQTMGHKNWEKSIRFDTYDDVKLEYMDLEEFLIENELPIDSVFDDQQNLDEENRRRSTTQPQQNTQQPLLQEDQYHKRASVESEAPHQSSLQSSDHLVNSTGHHIHPQQTNNENQQHSNNSSSHPQQLQQHQQSQPHHSSNLMVPGLQQPPVASRESMVPPSQPRTSVNTSLDAQSMISSSSLNVLSSGNCLRPPTTNGSSSSTNNHLSQNQIKSEAQDARMHLENSSSFHSRLTSGLYDDTGGSDKLSAAVRTACSPEALSPDDHKLDDNIRRYSFGEDDMKPPRDLIDESPGSPDSRRKRKMSLNNEDNKDDRYWERRRKNNMAAKRSRDARRVKENQIAMKATFYERENKILTQELGKARAEIHLLRERLCKYEIV